MTALQLRKQLDKLIETHGNCKIRVNVHELHESMGNLKDDCSIANPDVIEFCRVNMADDDGGVAMNKDGSERLSACFLIGSTYCRETT